MPTPRLRHAAAAVAALSALLLAAPASTSRLSPGPTFPLRATTSSSGAFLVTTVATHTQRRYAAIACQLDATCEQLNLTADPTSTPGDRMTQSMTDATTAADDLADLFTTATPTKDLHAPAGVAGSSAGLAFALHRLDTRLPGDLTAGATIAVTGSIDADGTVRPVAGVTHKARAVAATNATAFLVPAGEGPAARRGAGKVPVVEVATLREAVDWLCQHGATGAPCS